MISVECGKYRDQGIHKVVAGRGTKLKTQFQNEEMKLLEMVSGHFLCG